MKITIHVTKEIYRRAMMCGVSSEAPEDDVPANCAIALAVREIAPHARVYDSLIVWDNRESEALGRTPFVPANSEFSPEVTRRINDFDRLYMYPEKRLKLGEFSFNVEFPDEMIEQIGIPEIEKILSESETLSKAIV